MTVAVLPTTARNAMLDAKEREMLALRADKMPIQPVDKVAAATGLHPDIVTHLIRAGVLPGSVSPAGALAELDEAQKIAEKLAAARKTVAGNRTSATAASKKYGFSDVSILNWKKRGWIKVIGQRGAYEELDEGDVAFARALADVLGGVSPGRGVFPTAPRSGRPRKA